MNVILVRTGVIMGAVTALLLGGCSVGPNYHQPPMPVQGGGFGSAGGVATATGELAQAWWSGFNDPILNRLISQAVTNNYDVQLAQARLREARALWTAARFDYVPTITSESRYDKFQTTIDAAGKDRTRRNELYRSGFDATWELDLWGRVRRSVEAARATVESVEASRDDVMVSVQAEVTANYVELRGIQAQLDVSTRNATNQSQTLKLAEALRDGGQGTQLDVARARSLLNETLASVPPLEIDLQRTIHRISVLCGQPPSALANELSRRKPIPEAPAELLVSDPVIFLRLRPDVRSAERSLAAATARIGVEVADLFPRVTFVGSVSLQANTFSGVTSSGADTYSFGPHISWAAFDLGRVRQQIKAASARAEGSLAIYERTVLLALEETENSLVTLSRQRQRLGFLREAERAAAEASDLARQRYRDGIADYLSVLDAERTLLSLQDQLVTTETRTATSLVAVYKSFAAGR
jgi:outer membrane protein, multidrug efflux system